MVFYKKLKGEKMALPSNKYKKELLEVKRKLMADIAKYLDHGRFDMKETTVLYQRMEFGDCFRAECEIVKGDKHLIKVYKKEHDYAPMLVFKDYEDTEVEEEITVLMQLLDYIDYDSRK